MLDEALVEEGFGYLPHLLDANSVCLHVLALPQSKPLNHILAARSARTLRKQSLATTQLHAACKGILGGTVLADTNVLCRDAAHSAVGRVHHLISREARVHFDAKLLGLLC